MLNKLIKLMFYNGSTYMTVGTDEFEAQINHQDKMTTVSFDGIMIHISQGTKIEGHKGFKADLSYHIPIDRFEEIKKYSDLPCLVGENSKV